jgi:nucleoside-diphosphate-sugar epimerase
LIKLQQPKTVILASSGAIYGEGRRNHQGDNYLYSMLKQIQEEKIIEVCSKIGAKLIIARIFNLSGNGINKINTFAIAEMIVNAVKGQ